MRPLEGLRVLDLSRLLPGPFATLALADLGAEIIKVEAPPGGDYTRYYPPQGGSISASFGALNRDKRSIAINLKHPEGVAALKRLVPTFDIVVESFRPGVMDRLGVGYDTLRALNPRLIYCAITGYGQTGPLARRAGHDMNYQAVAGVLSMSGKDGEVVAPGIQPADIAGGSLWAVIGVLAALQERHRTGEGRFVDASMTDGVAGFGIMAQANAAMGQAHRPAGQDMLTGGAVCYRSWRCKDGKYLSVGALEHKFWQGFCAAVERPDLMSDGFASGKRGEVVTAELTALFASRTRDEWAALLGPHDVCVEPVLEPAEAAASEHAQARGLYGRHTNEREGAEFLHQYLNPALLPGAEPPAEVRPAPGMGQHTREIFAEAGFDAEEIEALLAAGAAVQAK